MIDHTMIRNLVQTNPSEALELFSLRLAGYVLVLGLVPVGFVWWVRLQPMPWEREIISKAKISVVCVLTIFGLVYGSSSFFFSFFREHETLRFYTNPTYALYSLGKYLQRSLININTVVRSLGIDAFIPTTDIDRELVILVVGEAARADHFSLNGYSRQTNPRLEQDDVISFSNVYSSATATAYAVPCMFSIYTREQCSPKKTAATENVLDVLQHAGAHILWRDNNSDSSGVALRVPYQNFQSPEVNTQCDSECRDEGMLIGLQEFIESKKEGDIVIDAASKGQSWPSLLQTISACI